MDRSRVAYLITEEFDQDSIGAYIKHFEEKKVYGNITSVSASEWFEGGRNGLNPSLRLTMFKYDYDGQSIIRIDDQLYTIYRTYEQSNDMIELYLEKRKGYEQDDWGQ